MTGGVIRVGTSGWAHAPWRGIFYPKGLSREEELVHAARHFRAIEINGTFYTTLRPEVFAGWAEQVPADFVFSVRAPRDITHILRLRDAHRPLARFLASGLLRLGIHIGPILWQLPPNFRFDPKRLEDFLRLLPRDTDAAAALGRTHGHQKHGHEKYGRVWQEAEFRRPVRHAFEIRHASFRCPEFIDLLRAYNVGLVCADSIRWPRLMDVTSDFVYCRLQGSDGPSAAGYDNAALDQWVHRITAWARGDEPADGERIGPKARRRRRDVFIFFDNDKKVRAPANAMELIRRLRS